MELGHERPGSLGGSVRSRLSFESPYGPSATSGYPWAPGRGSLQEDTATRDQPRSTPARTDSHCLGTQTNPPDPSELSDPGPSGTARPSDANTPGSIQKTSSTSEEKSWITMNHSPRHGRGSLDDGHFTIAGNPAAEIGGSNPYPSPAVSDDDHRPSSRQGRGSWDHSTIAGNPPAAESGSIPYHSPTVSEDGSSPTLEPPPRQGCGSLHEGTPTKGQLWGTQSHKVEQFVSYVAIHTANFVYSAGTWTKDRATADSAIPDAGTEFLPDAVQYQPISSFLSRNAISFVSLFASIVLVLMILDTHHEKQQWQAANEATRKMAWVLRVGGSYGHPYLSWLLRDAYLEVDAYSYG